MVLLGAMALWSARAAAQAPNLPTAGGENPAVVKPAPTKPAVAKPAAAPTSEAGGPKKADDRLSDEGELSRIAGLYEAGKYRECSSELERLLDPVGKAPLRQSAIVENARLYWSACLLGAGEADTADAPLRAAIHENPQMKPPDSLVFPQPVVQRFLRVRDSLVNEIRAAEQTRIKQAQAEARKREQGLARDRDRMAALENLARQQLEVVRNRRLFALIPFGVGQIQNRQEPLGYTLMVSELLLGSLSITAIAAQSRLAKKADELRQQGTAVDEEGHRQTQETWSTVKTASAWGFLALAIGGVVHAQLEFVPEFRETRPRALPPSLAPSTVPKPTQVSAIPYADTTGGGVNLVGRF